MKKQSFFAPLAIVACMAALFTSCGKEKLGSGVLADFVPAEASANAQAALVTVQDAVYEAVATSAALNDVPGSVQVGSCPEVTFTPKNAVDSFPAKLKVDFGTGCNWRGHTISGSFEMTVSGKISAGNTTMTAKIANLTVDGSTVSADMTLKTGTQALRSLTFTISNGMVTTDDGNTTTLTNLVFTRTQTEGQATTAQTAGLAALNDDVFEIMLTGEGINSAGKNFTISTPKTLLRKLNCRWISTGKLELKSPLTTSTLDFGTGDCDNQLVATVGNESKTIDLP